MNETSPMRITALPGSRPPVPVAGEPTVTLPAAAVRATALRKTHGPGEAAVDALAGGTHVRAKPAHGGPARAVGALVASLVLGIITAYGQTALPHALERAANSTGAWTLIAFAAVWWSQARPLPAALLGMASFLLLNVGYAMAADALFGGDHYSISLDNYWVVAGFLAGPLVGLGASWLRHRRDVLAALGIAGLSGVLIGDGYDGLTLYPSQSPVYWTLSAMLGVILVLAVAGVRLVGVPARAVAVAGAVVVAVCFHQATLATVNGVLRL